MATHTITIATFYDPMFQTLNVSISSNEIERGDSIVFDYSVASGNNANVDVSLLPSDVFTNSSDFTLSPSQTATRNISSSATYKTFTLRFYSTNGGYRYLDVTVVNNIDDTPDAFDLGANVTNANPNDQRYAGPITVSGINTPVSASISGTAEMTINNNNNWVTSDTVTVGDEIYVRMMSSSAYNSTVSTTLTIGGVSDSWSITTKADPGSGEAIPLGITTFPISLTDVIDFFGGDPYSNRNLRAYLRGGGLVPDITENAGIPVSGTLKLSDFLGSATALYLESEPGSQTALGNVSSSNATATMSWVFDGGRTWDPILGYGNIIEAVEIRWVLNDESGTVSIKNSINNDPDVHIFSTAHKGVILTASGTQGNEQFKQGSVTCYVRSLYDTSISISFTVNFTFNFYILQ